MDFVKKITEKELFKIASLNSLSVFFRIITGYVTSKIIAVFVGPAGMALVGNFRNFLSTTETLGTLGFQNGIIKYIAEHENDYKQLQKTLSTLIMILLPIILILSFLFWLFSEELNTFFFGKNYQYGHLFQYLAPAFPFYIASLIVTAVLNGFSQFKKVVYLNIIGNLLGLVLSVTLVMTLRIEGALMSAFLLPTILFFVSLFYLKNYSGLIVFKREYFDSGILKSFFEYSLMAIVPSIAGPIVSVAIRKSIIASSGIENAGYWEALNRISDFYFLFLSTLLTVYFLPKLSKANDNSETTSIFKNYYKWIVPLFSAGLILVYVLKEFIVRILLAKTFLPVTELFLWRIVGDFFKALSLILGYQLWAKKMTKVFLVTELFSWLILIICSFILIPKFGTEGAVMAHAIEYFLYLIVLIVYFRKSLF